MPDCEHKGWVLQSFPECVGGIKIESAYHGALGLSVRGCRWDECVRTSQSALGSGGSTPFPMSEDLSGPSSRFILSVAVSAVLPFCRHEGG